MWQIRGQAVPVPVPFPEAFRMAMLDLFCLYPGDCFPAFGKWRQGMAQDTGMGTDTRAFQMGGECDR